MEKRIKILFLIDELLMGGTEKQLLLLADGLPRDSFEPVIAVLHKTQYLADLRVKTRITDLNWSGFPLVKNLSLLYKLTRYLDKEQFDILQTQFVEATIYGAWATRFCRQRPFLITTRRNLYHWVDEAPWSFRFLRHTVRWTDRILVNSHCVLQACQRMENIPPEKIALIQNGVEVEKFDSISPEEAKRNIELNTDSIVIGVVGNWRPIKGLRSFLVAAQKVYREIPVARFVLVGNGPQEHELRTVAGDLGIKDRVTFLGNSTHVPTAMAAFDVAVQPSLSESLSNVLLEYMAAGRPTVATRVGDAEMIIDQGNDGLLVKAGDPEEMSSAILSLIRNRDIATQMGQFARRKVLANWSSQKIIKAYQVFYEELAQHKRGGN